MNLIKREIEIEIKRLTQFFSAITLTGPRQSGKTTLCKSVFSDYKYVNLEDIQTREMIELSPKSFLKENSRGLIIDEAHYLPDLFSYIQVLVDEDISRRFILTSSSNFFLMQRVTQSLAGRTAILSLLPLSLNELDQQVKLPTDKLLLNGGYPIVWSGRMSAQDTYRNYYNTYVEKDVRLLINIKNISLFQRFIKLCAGRIGYEFNASTFANDIGVSVPTIQDWLSKLEASFIVYRLQPFYKNSGKRIVKSSKLYFYDTGLACYLLGIENETHLNTHHLRGNLFKNLIVIDFLKNRYNKGKDSNIYFYRDNLQKEVDLIQENVDNLSAFEIKSAKDFHKDFLKGLNYFKKLFPNQVQSTQLIYDGELENLSNDNGILNFRNMSGLNER